MKKMRRSQPRSLLLRCGFAVLMVILFTLLRIPLNPLLGVNAVPFLHYFPAILISGWYGRLVPGLLATFLSAIGALYFNIDASLVFSIPNIYETFRLSIFLLVGVVISLVTEAWHRSQEALSESKNIESQQRELLEVTLSSIADAVIATGPDGRVTFMQSR
jgi:two-component system sensor histidine kinase/response regulator